MKKKLLDQQIETKQQHPYAKIPWSSLTDTQKAQLLLDGQRLLDAEKFINDFKSWEQPEVNTESD